VQQQQEIKA